MYSVLKYKEADMLKCKIVAAIIVLLIPATISSNEQKIIEPNVAERFRVMDIYLGMNIDELRDITDNNKHRIFRDCKEKRSYEFGYMYCSNNEAGFRFDKNGRLTRFWFGINQAEKIYGRKFKNEISYVTFVKSRFHIKALAEHDGKPQYDSATGRSTIPKTYSLVINRWDYLEINEISTLTIGQSGLDKPMYYDFH
jgi:hypothetical protein